MIRRRLLTTVVAVGVALLFAAGPAVAAPGDGVETSGADLINDGDQAGNDDALRGDVLDDGVGTDGADLINDGDQAGNDDALRGGLVGDFDDGVGTDGADLINDGDQGGISAGSGD